MAEISVKTDSANTEKLHLDCLSEILSWQTVDIDYLYNASSTRLSLLVGMIAWNARDPCIPLVIALFIMMGMSSNSVVKFFSRI